MGHEDHLLLEGGPVRIPGGAALEGLGQKTFGVHRLPDRAVRGEEQGEGGDGLRGGRGGEERGRCGRRRAEDRGGRRGEGEGREEEKNEKGEGGVSRVGAAQQEQASVDAEAR